MNSLWCPTEAIIWLESTSYSTNFPIALSKPSMPNLEENCTFHFTHLQFELYTVILSAKLPFAYFGKLYKQ